MFYKLPHPFFPVIKTMQPAANRPAGFVPLGLSSWPTVWVPQAIPAGEPTGLSENGKFYMVLNVV
jgi:hypothetical protein